MDQRQVHDLLLKQKLQQLEQLEKQIEILEQQLKDARDLRVKLQQDIEIFQRDGPSIRKLPPELLTIIFRNYLDKNASIIRRLLLVCRQWHSLIKDNSNLWSIIRIAPGPYDDLESLKSRRHYINTCLRNSSNLPLDITIDYGGLSTLYGLCVKALRVVAHQLRCRNCEYYDKGIDLDVEEEEDMVRDWLDGQWFRENEGVPLMLQYDEHCAHLLHELAGNRGEHMLRWRSFHFSGPKWRDSTLYPPYIYSTFQHPSPILEQLSLVRIPAYNYTRNVVLPQVEQLRSLSLIDSLTLAKISSSQSILNMQHLNLEYNGYHEPEELITLFRLVNLKTLRLNAGWEGINSQMIPPTTTFSDLTILKLRGDFNPKIFVAMRLPKLQVLVLENDRAFITVVDADFVLTVPHLELCFYVEETILKYLHRFESVEVLKVNRRRELMFKDIIRRLFSTGSHIRKLHTLLLTAYGERPERSVNIGYLAQGVQFWNSS